MHTFLEVHTQIEAADSTPCEILKPNFITISQGVTVSYDEIKQKVITQANDYYRVKAYTP